jgi:hypothetical protein
MAPTILGVDVCKNGISTRCVLALEREAKTDKFNESNL